MNLVRKRQAHADLASSTPLLTVSQTTQSCGAPCTAMAGERRAVVPWPLAREQAPAIAITGLERSGVPFLGETAIWAIFEFYNHICGSRNSSRRAIASQLAGERF